MKDWYHKRLRMMEKALQEERLKTDPNAKPLPSVVDDIAGMKTSRTSRRSRVDHDDAYMEVVKHSQEGLRSSAGRSKSRTFLEKCLTEVTYLVTSHPSISLNKPVGVLDDLQSPLSMMDRPDARSQAVAQAKEINELPTEIAPRRPLSPVPPRGTSTVPSDALSNEFVQDSNTFTGTESTPLDEIALEDHNQIEKVRHVFDSHGQFVEQEQPKDVSNSSGGRDPTETINEASGIGDEAWDLEESSGESTLVDISDFADSREPFVVKALLRGQLSSVNAVRVVSATKDLWIASAGAESTIKLHKYPEIMPILTLRSHTGLVNCLCIEQTSGPEVKLLTGGEDMVIRKWSVQLDETNRYTEPVAPEMTFINHSQPITALATVGGDLVSASADRSVRLWDMNTGASKAVWWLSDRFPDASPTAICGAGGSKFVVGYTDGQIKLFDTSDPNLSHDFSKRQELPQSQVTCILFWEKKDNLSQIITAHKDMRIRFFEVSSRKFLRSFTAHTAAVTCLTLIDPTRLVSASHDNSVRIWDIESGECVQEITTHQSKNGEGVQSIDYSEGNGAQDTEEQGGCLVSAGADGTIAVYMREQTTDEDA